MTENSQKFLARNRAPRVQIEYDVELYGSQKTVQLPFVMGVMSDLAGKSNVSQPEVEDRSFLDIDVDNFDDRMRAMAPRVAFEVPNTLTGNDNVSVDLTFEKMDDFSPAAIAGKVDSLRPLLEARTQLSNLMAYMDGKAGAEALIEKILADPALLSAVSAASDGANNQDAALDSLRVLTPEDETEQDTTEDILASLGTHSTTEDLKTNTTEDVLSKIARQPDEVVPEENTADAVLAGLGSTAPQAQTSESDLQETLAALSAEAPQEDEIPDSSKALESLADLDLPDAPDDNADSLLANLAASAPEVILKPDSTTDVLEGFSDLSLPELPGDTTDDLLADLAATDPSDSVEPDVTDDVLSDLADLSVPDLPEDTTDEFLADLADEQPELESNAGESVDGLLADLADVDVDLSASDDPVDNILNDLSPDDPLSEAKSEEPVTSDDLGDLSSDADNISLDDLLGDSADDGSDDDDSVLDALLNDADGGDAALDDLLAESGQDGDDNLDSLLDDLSIDDDTGLDSSQEDTSSEIGSDLDDLLGDLSSDESNLDDLLGDLEENDDSLNSGDPVEDVLAEPEFAYGQMSEARPEPEQLNRKRFRLAILGDFSGRAAKGTLETGDQLATRKPILLDPDTVEDVIEGFATDLVLPVGKDGAGVAVKLGGLDDLHPDELYQNVELFAELVGLRGQLASGATAENAAQRLREWGEKYGHPVVPAKTRSAGNAVPADRKLSDFQRLIGDSASTLTHASPLDDLLARVVGPHIRAIPDADTVAMQGAVDKALSAAMRLVLHHPEFQSVESQWRSLDLIARSIETDDTLDVMLYDISAEEIAADLAASDDLAQSGFARLLTEDPLDQENGRGGYSALIGLYTFEETPPHAELLGRIARLAAHVDAPFFAAITPAFLDTPKEDRIPLVANAWETLRAMPEAGHLGLVSPRFLLRRPYGAKSEPIYEFGFEEFTMSEGMKGMLWANPVVLVAILLAKSFRENGAAMSLGSIMSLGDMPFHFVNDQYGDQVALPCTERNLTLDKIEAALTRGIMSIAAPKGRNEIRLTSFGSLAGGEILGPWTGTPPPPPSPPKLEPAITTPEELDSDDGSGDDMDLDDLLAGFGDDTDSGGDDDDTDAELAALLGDL